jgi:methylsterol monooxygenase
MTPDLVLMSITVLFNKFAGPQFYDWLNARYTPFQIHCYGSFIITTAVYWVIGLLFLFLDLTPRPSRYRWVRQLQEYKVQPFKTITPREYRDICLIVLRNQFFVAFPLSIFMAAFVAPMRGMSTLGKDLPGFWGTLGTYVFCMICEEIGFFYVHRFLHHPSRYQKYHKMHHNFTAPCALASTYCTMTEHVTSNLAPIFIGLLILGSHWSMIVYFFCGLEIGTLMTHSGYCIPYMHNPLRHDYHHFAFTENFGPVGLLDWYYGTSKEFSKTLSAAIERAKGNRAQAEEEMMSDLAKKAMEADEDEQ